MGKKRTLNELRQTKDAHYIPKYDPQTGDKNPYYKELTGEELEEMMNETDAPPGVQFVNEVEIFNATFGKPNNYVPTIPEKKETDFVYDFCIEEITEYQEACRNGDIVEILDAI